MHSSVARWAARSFARLRFMELARGAISSSSALSARRRTKCHQFPLTTAFASPHMAMPSHTTPRRSPLLVEPSRLTPVREPESLNSVEPGGDEQRSLVGAPSSSCGSRRDRRPDSLISGIVAPIEFSEGRLNLIDRNWLRCSWNVTERRFRIDRVKVRSPCREDSSLIIDRKYWRPYHIDWPSKQQPLRR